MNVTVQLFGALRERTGRDRAALCLEPGATVRGALLALAAAFPEAAHCYDSTSGKAIVLPVLRGEKASLDSPLADGDALELIWPIAGG